MTNKTKEEINHVASTVASVGTELVRELEKTIQQQKEEIERLEKDWQWALNTIKDREGMIKELIDTFDLFDEVPLPFKIVNKMESVVKKARKLIREKQ